MSGKKIFCFIRMSLFFSGLAFSSLNAFDRVCAKRGFLCDCISEVVDTGCGWMVQRVSH